MLEVEVRIWFENRSSKYFQTTHRCVRSDLLHFWGNRQNSWIYWRYKIGQVTSLLPSWPALGQLPSFSRVLLLRVLIQTCTLDICDQAHTLWRVIKLQLWIEELHEKPRSILTKDYINVLMYVFMYVFMYVYWYWSNCFEKFKNILWDHKHNEANMSVTHFWHLGSISSNSIFCRGGGLDGMLGP